MKQRKKYLLFFALMLNTIISTSQVYAEQEYTDYYKGSKFALGVGAVIVRFDADVVIDDDLEKQDICYGYDGAYIGMHFLL